ncbi:hypothetical protein F5Y05DRAFT_409047 [Hypoxylon sp. FL0543]|nr:hypothetical protein F5Y05DRAFT_409047 [Hypoxylon sp. FL0543]
MATDATPPLFTKFNDLPPELRRIVWKLALPDDNAEICIPWPLNEEAAYWRRENGVLVTHTNFLEPYLVDTCFPVIMHVCRESRDLAVSQLRFRYSPLAGCPVPFRAFRPDLDIMHVSFFREPTDEHEMPRWPRYPRGTQHLAFDLHTLKDGSHLWILVGQASLDVRTVTCILPASNAILDTAVRVRPPVRRCRLRPVEQPSDGSQSHIIWVDRGFDRRMTGLRHYLEEVQDRIGTQFLEYLELLQRVNRQEKYNKRWNAAECRFDIEFLAQTFEEHRGGRWVPSSDHTVYFDFQSPRSSARCAANRYHVSEAEKWAPLRNPETFRVNDIQQNEVPFQLY